MSILKINNLTKVYDSYKGTDEVIALDDISLDVEKGDFVGIMGPSGSGKTTLLNIISGIDKATSGSIIVSGANICNMKKDEIALFRRKNMGYIFQDFNLLDSLTLKENVGLPLILDKVEPKEIEERTEDLMEFFGIYKQADKYPYNVSGGQRQRVAAARALINNPSIVYADEPTGNLDSKSANSIMEIMDKMNKERESTILMVTHDAFAASFCKKIVFIKDGKIVMEINSNGNRKDFFDKILEAQSVIGGMK